jgi:hypothetical protein
VQTGGGLLPLLTLLTTLLSVCYVCHCQTFTLRAPGQLGGPAFGKRFAVTSVVKKRPSCVVVVLAGQNQTISLGNLFPGHKQHPFYTAYGLKDVVSEFTIPEECVLAKVQPFMPANVKHGSDGSFVWQPATTVEVSSWMGGKNPLSGEEQVEKLPLHLAYQQFLVSNGRQWQGGG